MPLNQIDQNLNYDIVKRITLDVIDFYDTDENRGDLPLIRAKLHQIQRDVISLLDRYELILDTDQAIADLKNVLSRVVVEPSLVKIAEELKSVVKRSKQLQKHAAQTAVANYDLTDSLKKNKPADFRSGSVKDLTTLLQGYSKNPEAVAEKVEILTHISLESTARADVQTTPTKLLHDHIKKVFDKNPATKTKTLLIPVKCDAMWRLLIVSINAKKKKIEKAVLWDSKDSSTADHAKSLKHVQDALRDLDPSLSIKKIKPHHSFKYIYENASLDYVVQKAWKSIPKARIENDANKAIISQFRHERFFGELRPMTLSLLTANDPSIIEERAQSKRPVAVVSHVPAPEQVVVNAEGLQIERIDRRDSPRFFRREQYQGADKGKEPAHPGSRPGRNGRTG